MLVPNGQKQGSISPGHLFISACFCVVQGVVEDTPLDITLRNKALLVMATPAIPGPDTACYLRLPLPHCSGFG